MRYSPLSRRPIARLLMISMALVGGSTSVQAGRGSVRATAMADAYTALATGVEATAWNPANLSLHREHALSIELFSAAALLGNNAFDLDLYNRTMGAELDDHDKTEILSAIPAGGVRTSAEASAGALGVQVGRFAVGMSAQARAFGQLPREFFELILMGNSAEDEIRFDDASAEAISYGSLHVSGAAPVAATHWANLHAGITLRYLRGLAHVQLEQAYGSVTTDPAVLQGEALAVVRTASTGHGFGLSAGLATHLGTQWRAGLSFENLFARIRFDQDVERRVFVARIDSLSIVSLEEREDSAGVYERGETVVAAEPFTVGLPMVVRLGAARVGESTSWSVEWEQGFTRRAGSHTIPRLATGAEWRARKWSSLRAGLAVGGSAGTTLGLGCGLSLGEFQLDLAASTVGTWWPADPKGFALALGTGLRF